MMDCVLIFVGLLVLLILVVPASIYRAFYAGRAGYLRANQVMDGSIRGDKSNGISQREAEKETGSVRQQS